MISNKHVFCLAASACLVSFAYSSENPETYTDIEETIITSARIPIPLEASLPTSHLITSADIELIKPRDLASLLGRVSGLDFRDSGGRGSANGIFVRGSSAPSTLILIDGVRSASATTGQTDLNNIPVENIERIEIVKGPLSSLYGADALGGVINVITKAPSNQGFDGSVNLSFGGNAFQEYGLSTSYGNSDHQFGLNISYEDTDGIDRTLSTDQGNGDDDGFEQFNLGLSANLTLADNIDASLRYLHTDSTTEFDNPFGADLGRFTDNEVHKLSANIVHAVSDDLTLTYDLGYFEDHSETPVFASDITTERVSLGVNAGWQYTADTTLVAGADYYDDDVDTLSDFPVTERDNLGVYAQVLHSPAGWNAVASIRYDDNEAYGTETTGTLAVGYEITSELELVLSYGKAFRAPSFNELYFPFFGNPDVQPESSDSYEASLKFSRGVVDARLSVYDTQVDNLIAYDVDIFLANNIQEASLQGLEAEVGASLANWYFSANVDYLDATNETTGTQLTDRATVTANLSAQTQIGDYSVLVDWQAETGRVDGATDIGGFGILGLSLDYQATEKLLLSLRADNLFDQYYVLNLANGPANPYQTEGRVARASLRYNF